MNKTNDSIDKLIEVLSEIPNKEQTIDNFIETIFTKNVQETFGKTDSYLKNEIDQNKKLLLFIKHYIHKE